MADGNATMEDWGKLLLRLGLGGLMLFHGVDKLLHGTAGIEGMLAARGLPAAAVYGVYVGEVLAPLLLLVGAFVRPAGFVLAFNMAVAMGLAHMGDLWGVGSHGEWVLETPMLYLLGGLALAFLGGGRIGLTRR